jgi:hypothetical protein
MSLLLSTKSPSNSFDIWMRMLPQDPARTFAGYRTPPSEETCMSGSRSTRAQTSAEEEAAFDRLALDRFSDDGGPPARDD